MFGFPNSHSTSQLFCQGACLVSKQPLNFPIVLPKCLFGFPNSLLTSQVCLFGFPNSLSTSQLLYQGVCLVPQIASQLPNCSSMVLVWFPKYHLNFQIVLPRWLFGFPNSLSTCQLFCQVACLVSQIVYKLPNCSANVIDWKSTQPFNFPVVLTKCTFGSPNSLSTSQLFYQCAC